MKVTLTGPQETMLATLYGKALDFRTARPILGGRLAVEVLDQIDYDFRKAGMNPTSAAGVALRSRQLDDWTRAFLTDHPSATVLHLACGLDARPFRIAHPETVRWVDVDLPDVIALREQLLPTPPGDYRIVAGSVTDAGWLESVPADRPVCAVFEGLTMYLHPADVRRLVERITGRFPAGQLLFDVYGTLGIRLQKFVPAVRNSGATLHWGVDDPRELEAWHPGLTLMDALSSVDMPGLDELPRLGQLQMRVLKLIPGLRDIGQILRYRF